VDLRNFLDGGSDPPTESDIFDRTLPLRRFKKITRYNTVVLQHVQDVTLYNSRGNIAFDLKQIATESFSVALT